MNDVNSDGDRISNQNQKDGAHGIVSGIDVGELKGKSIIRMKAILKVLTLLTFFLRKLLLRCTYLLIFDLFVVYKCLFCR